MTCAGLSASLPADTEDEEGSFLDGTRYYLAGCTPEEEATALRIARQGAASRLQSLQPAGHPYSGEIPEALTGARGMAWEYSRASGHGQQAAGAVAAGHSHSGKSPGMLCAGLTGCTLLRIARQGAASRLQALQPQVTHIVASVQGCCVLPWAVLCLFH